MYLKQYNDLPLYWAPIEDTGLPGPYYFGVEVWGKTPEELEEKKSDPWIWVIIGVIVLILIGRKSK